MLKMSALCNTIFLSKISALSSKRLLNFFYPFLTHQEQAQIQIHPLFFLKGTCPQAVYLIMMFSAQRYTPTIIRLLPYPAITERSQMVRVVWPLPIAENAWQG